MAIAFPVAPLQALPLPESAPALTFAACTGRLSALMEHQWITDPPASDRTQALRAQMIDLLMAASDPDEGRLMLRRRLEAKAALAQLLTRARSERRADLAQTAQRMADRDVAACTSLLLH
ncbi:hypothetical protein [Pseudooceanicola sp. LIPI14-2-Ac024]|uniref:hypothetical protein n=1 Tax=Pseudooceanicola sp. LIPI14-2-Ac024 TaxID=3344875 RepID=UPI0035CED28D